MERISIPWPSWLGWRLSKRNDAEGQRGDGISFKELLSPFLYHILSEWIGVEKGLTWGGIVVQPNVASSPVLNYLKGMTAVFVTLPIYKALLLFEFGLGFVMFKTGWIFLCQVLQQKNRWEPEWGFPNYQQEKGASKKRSPNMSLHLLFVLIPLVPFFFPVLPQHANLPTRGVFKPEKKE